MSTVGKRAKTTGRSDDETAQRTRQDEEQEAVISLAALGLATVPFWCSLRARTRATRRAMLTAATVIAALSFASVAPAASSLAGASSPAASTKQDVQAMCGAAPEGKARCFALRHTDIAAHKGAGLLELSKLLGVPAAEIAVIGDGGNDVLMFEQSGLSVAMGNAEPAVKAAADFVTDSNAEDGFAKAIERFILGGER